MKMKVLNYSELHFAEETFYKIHTLKKEPKFKMNTHFTQMYYGYWLHLGYRISTLIIQYNATYSEFEFAKLGPNFLKKV